MKVIREIKKMQELSLRLKRAGKSIGFVPTMGYLHEGHLSLMRQAKLENDVSIISIFVNPLQFGSKEDLKKYPRDFKRDYRLAKNVGVDVLFFPSNKEMYKEQFLSEVYVRELSKILCGESRPEHFKGVTTVVAKLFNIVLPDFAYFGQKDLQQVRILEQLARDLNFPLKIKILPIIREPDGLAMSSRNKYLSKEDRQDAAILYRSLKEARHIILTGTRQGSAVISTIKRLISTIKSAKIEYVEIVDAHNLRRVDELKGEIAILLAAMIKKVRLIDNIIMSV
ncbi:MAG: pantoate--beta-alanine ligase [Candidatus Omnitrophota bacterium]